MKPTVRLTLTAGAVALVCACTSDTPQQPFSEPLRASFSDGAHSGNPDFFFVPPLFKSPTSNPNYSPGEFNAALQPSVEICELAALVPPATIRACGATIETFAGSAVALDAANEQYQVNWNTDESNLVLTKDYRIRVLLGTQELGYADVDPVSSGSQLKNVETGEYIGLVDGRTLPIKFRIENGAACSGGDCDSKTIDLAQGGFVELETTGDRVDIPAQQSGQVVTITVQLCEDIDVDLPVFGNCLSVIPDPPLAARLSPAATVSICSLDPLSLPLVHAQQDLLTLHRQDDEVVVALPHSDDFCETPIGQSQGNGVWQTLRNAVGWMFKPATLHASTMVLDVGAGGESDFFSDFQFALPGKMNIVSLADQVADPNAAVSSVPEVVVTDADGNPVANARVHFQITSTGGGGIAPLDGVVLSNADGHAALTQWTLGAVGRHTLQAFGKGIADPENNGPADGFDPFAPAVLHDPDEDEAQPPVTLGTGRLDFGATASPVINFETFPDGSPACDNCALTDQFASRGVVFSFAPLSETCVLTNAQLFLSSSAYDEAGGPANHSVTSAGLPAGGFCNGTVSAAFAGTPGTVTFRLRGNDGIAVYPINAFDATGAPIAASQIQRTDVSTFTSVGGFLFRQETITISNAGGIGRVDLVMDGFIVLLDNLLITP